jgi:hypothetical protein
LYPETRPPCQLTHQVHGQPAPALPENTRQLLYLSGSCNFSQRFTLFDPSKICYIIKSQTETTAVTKYEKWVTLMMPPNVEMSIPRNYQKEKSPVVEIT